MAKPQARPLTAVAKLLILLVLAAAAGCPGSDPSAGRNAGAADTPSADGPKFDPPVKDDAFGTEAMDDPRPQSLPRSFLHINGRKITVEVADNERRREKGLMYRQALPDDTGMIFLYPEVQRTGAKYWNQNVPIDLDVAFAGPDGRIVAIVTMKARDPSSLGTDKPVAAALEMPGGWFAKNGFKLNDKFEFSPALKAARAK